MENTLSTANREAWRVLPGTIRDQAYQKMHQAIVTGFFLPGQRLIERELCELLGVSRTSLREALRILETEKLILVEPYKGPCVATVSLEEASKIYEVRRVLEQLAGERAAVHATDEEIAQLGREADSFDEAVHDGKLPLLVASAARFFEILLHASRNQVVYDMLRSLNARVSVLRAMSMSDKGRASHSAIEMREIYDAVKSRDSLWAGAACARHVAKAAAAAKKYLSEADRTEAKKVPASDSELEHRKARTMPKVKQRQAGVRKKKAGSKQ